MLAKELYIFSFGLFPFFTRASIQIQPDLISIFLKYYLPLGIELVPMLSGLIACVLPGLEEQDEKLKQDINDLLNKINISVGNKFYMNAVWMIMLNNQKLRIPCIKVLN